MTDAKTTAKTTTAAESLDKKKPTESIDKPIDMEALRKQIRAEEAEKLRAEVEAGRQAELCAEKDNFDEVVCMIDNVHTSKGKMFKDATKHLPKSEVDILVAQKKVERT